MSRNSSRWRTSGVRIIRPDELDDATAQTLGMHRRAAVTTKRTGATKLWAGTVTIEPAAKTGAHHHGDLERSGQQGLVVNLDITPVEVPELVRWIDDLHK
jgi:uncharacterized RmlC-like cupin family protein